MRHLALPRFWFHYRRLPDEIQQLADEAFARLQSDPRHPALRFKQVGRRKQLWSVRVGKHYRALAVEKSTGMVWFWIGPHAEYDQLLDSMP